MNIDIEEEYFENQDIREEELKQSEYTGIQDY